MTNQPAHSKMSKNLLKYIRQYVYPIRNQSLVVLPHSQKGLKMAVLHLVNGFIVFSKQWAGLIDKIMAEKAKGKNLMSSMFKVYKQLLLIGFMIAVLALVLYRKLKKSSPKPNEKGPNDKQKIFKQMENLSEHTIKPSLNDSNEKDSCCEQIKKALNQNKRNQLRTLNEIKHEQVFFAIYRSYNSLNNEDQPEYDHQRGSRPYQKSDNQSTYGGTKGNQSNKKVPKQARNYNNKKQEDLNKSSVL